jgi:hypothetical protein
MNIDIFSAFIVGILGSGHCLGMCGGITSMLTTSISTTTTFKKSTLIVSYHIGRLFSYSLLGAIVGYTGSFAAKNIGVPFAGLRLVAAIFLILLGLYLGQWLMWLSKIERVGKLLWQYISPLSQHVIPVSSPTKALILGGIWGWLPCGLVYSSLTWSLATGSALNGAAIMLFFGLGTLPALLCLSFGLLKIKQIIQSLLFKRIMAILIIFYGFYSFLIAYSALFL